MGNYLKLKQKYLLRGWTGLMHGVTNDETGETGFLPGNVYDTLKLCNGRFEADSPVFIGERKKHLKKMIECGLIEEVDEPSSLMPAQEYRTYDNRFMQMVHWSITGHCNYRCRHCYMSAPHAALPQPDHDECIRIIDEIASCGIRQVSITGGEALIRDDFLSLVDHMLERDLRIVMIMSNGALVNGELLNELEKRDIRPEFNLSYDGTEGQHDWLRGVPGAEKAVERAFLLCREHGFPTGSEFCLHRGNAALLRDSVKRLGEWGVGSLKVSGLCVTGEGQAIRDHALSSGEEFETYLAYIPQYMEDGMPVKRLILSGVFSCIDGKAGIPFVKGDEDHPNEKQLACRASRMTMYLGPDGRILPCIPMSETEKSQEHFPGINGISLREALTDSTYISFIRTNMGQYLEHNAKCRSCEYKYRCGGGCRGRAVIENDGEDLLGIDPDTCLFFRGGYYDRVKKLIQ